MLLIPDVFSQLKFTNIRLQPRGLEPGRRPRERDAPRSPLPAPAAMTNAIIMCMWATSK